MATSLTSAVTVTSPKSMIPHTRLASAEISVLSGLKSLCTSWVRWAASRGATWAASRPSCSPSRLVPLLSGRPASSGRSCGSCARSHSSGRRTSGSSNSRSARPSRARETPRVRRREGSVRTDLSSSPSR